MPGGPEAIGETGLAAGCDRLAAVRANPGWHVRRQNRPCHAPDRLTVRGSPSAILFGPHVQRRDTFPSRRRASTKSQGTVAVSFQSADGPVNMLLITPQYNSEVQKQADAENKAHLPVNVPTTPSASTTQRMICRFLTFLPASLPGMIAVQGLRRLTHVRAIPLLSFVDCEERPGLSVEALHGPHYPGIGCRLPVSRTAARSHCSIGVDVTSSRSVGLKRPRNLAARLRRMLSNSPETTSMAGQVQDIPGGRPGIRQDCLVGFRISAWR